MSNIVTVPLPQDLPENWRDDQYVAPEGLDVGLSIQHGYNYLMRQVNNAQKAAQELDEGALSSGGRFQMGGTENVELSSIGWYRVAMLEKSVAGNANALLFLGHNYNNGGPSSLLVSVNFNSSAPSIVVLDYKSSSVPFFDKIRLVNDPSVARSYLDVHYNRTALNSVVAGILFFTYEKNAVGKVQSFAVVDDELSRGTVLLSQNITPTKNGTVLTNNNKAADINAVPLGLVEEVIAVSSAESLDSALDSQLSKMAVNTSRYITVHFSVVHPVLGGVARILRIDKLAESYAVVQALGYSTEKDGVVSEFYRSKYNGIWTNWARNYNTFFKPTAVDIGAAPSSYGLGEVTGKFVNNLDTTVLGGFYQFGLDAVGAPASYGVLLVLPRGTGGAGEAQYTAQIVVDHQLNMFLRNHRNGAWAPWVEVGTSSVAPATVE